LEEEKFMNGGSKPPVDGGTSSRVVTHCKIPYGYLEYHL